MADKADLATMQRRHRHGIKCPQKFIKQVRRLFKLADKDGEGSLDRQEIRQMMVEEKDALLHAFPSFNLDIVDDELFNWCAVARAPVPGAETQPSACPPLLPRLVCANRYDADGSGSLDEHEFVQMLKKEIVASRLYAQQPRVPATPPCCAARALCHLPPSPPQTSGALHPPARRG